MSDRAKLFINGGSQAVRLPKSCRFPDGVTEVVARREGNLVILEDPDTWPQSFIDVLGSAPDFPLPLDDEPTAADLHDDPFADRVDEDPE